MGRKRRKKRKSKQSHRRLKGGVGATRPVPVSAPASPSVDASSSKTQKSGPTRGAAKAEIPDDGPPRKILLTVLWILLLGAGVVVVQSLFVSGGGGEDDSPQMSAVPIGGMPPTALSEAALDMFEAPEKGAARKKLIRPKKPHQAIEDKRHSLCPFYKALATLDKAEEGEGEPVRILHYGDSILTTDELSGRVRSQLQKRFGDGGHGFVLLGKPWRWYRHQNVTLGAQGKWQVRTLTSTPSKDGIWGLGGVTFDTRHPRARAWVGPDPDGERKQRVSEYEISFLGQPRGGSFDVMIDDLVVETVSTEADHRTVVHKVIDVDSDAAMLSIKTLGDGPVRVFGAVMENGEPGVVYDSLAINGVRVANFRRFDEDHFATELQRRNAKLVVMMCGANEGNNDALALGAYRENLTEVLQRIRRALPDAGCLVVGPLDQAQRGEDGTLVSKKMPKKLTRLQREVSYRTGCAFFDTFSAMGGEGSMPKWYRRGLVGADFIHPTETGAKMVGSWLTEALLAGYENFLFNGEQCESNVTSL